MAITRALLWCINYKENLAGSLQKMGNEKEVKKGWDFFGPTGCQHPNGEHKEGGIFFCPDCGTTTVIIYPESKNETSSEEAPQGGDDAGRKERAE